jgi:hypothetical protein
MWWTIGAFIAGLVVGVVGAGIFILVQLGALAGLGREAKLVEDGHKRSEFRSEL